jgi:CRISPR/Cas system-associated endonuclease Cas1
MFLCNSFPLTKKSGVLLLKLELRLDKVVLKCTIDIKITILFCGQEFIDTYHFINYYDANNNSLLKKYGIYNVEEFQTKFIDKSINNIQEDLSFLIYHIHKRKELEKIGVQMPNNIIRTSL